MAEQEFREVEKQLEVARSRTEEAVARKASRQAHGPLEAEAELARRERELAEAEAALAMLEIGTRPEEVEAEQAHLARVEEELRYLQSLRGKVVVATTIAGLVTTPRLKAQVGRYLREGELICAIEALGEVEAQVALPEEDRAKVQPGQAVELKLRALPFDTIFATVTAIAPNAAPLEAPPAGTLPTHPDRPTSVQVYSRLANPPTALCPGMTGHARIQCGRKSAAAILLGHALRLVRAEFWW
jgi:multidrug efflux pump subunit AcrA (membrane-fusion protein)